MKSTLAIGSVIFTISILSIPVVWSDSDFDWDKYKRKSSGVAAVSNPVYQEECGSCHMAYPPGLLPSRSWEKIMDHLDKHFDDNAELDPQTHQTISQLLTKNSADKSNYRRSQKFSRSISQNDIPLRITETPYFIREHNEIPKRMVSGNPKVQSFSQCNSCHLKAEKGSFNEHNINIPGYGRWDD